MAWHSSTQYVATSSDDLTIKLWQAESGECLQTLTGHTHYVFCVAFNPVAAQLVCSPQHMIALEVTQPMKGPLMFGTEPVIQEIARYGSRLAYPMKNESWDMAEGKGMIASFTDR